MQARLTKLETKELDLISKQSKDEAVKLALALAAYPAPPTPVFDLNDEFKDPEKLADLIDDVFGK